LPEERQAAIRHLSAPYLESYQALNPKLHFRKMDQPNALALMSGDIIFTDAFIDLAENNEEVLAVFFHEIGHL
jgi:Zn-dependent protease with chaperone function